MNKKHIIVLILALMCFLTINAAFANEVNGTTTSSDNLTQEITDVTDDMVLQGSKSFKDLSNDLANCHDSEFNVTSDYQYSFLDLGYSDGIAIKRDITINGNGHTIDGNKQAKMFYITDDNLNVIIKDLTFINGETSENGGAISGKCTVINCTFIYNTAFNGGALYGPSAINCTFKDNFVNNDGGAIYIDSPDVIIENCTFENNHANRLGGSIAINSVLNGTTISDSTFRKNTAQKGGALSVDHSQNLTLSNSKFISNEASLDGGAIHYDFSLQNILDNCYFENNIADGNGGAFTWILSNGNITNSRFNRNTAKNNGGAIYLNISNTSVLVERQVLTDCNFTENSAMNGGALYCNEFYRITDGTFNFIKNSAKQNGGAVYCGNLSFFSDSLFLNNTAQENGGALYCNDSCSIFGSKFINNYAKVNGGAIAANNHNFLFDNQFVNNSAKTGGAMYCNDYDTVSKADFINNTAEDDGGAFHGNNYCLVYNSKFNNNSAYHGGAVYFAKYNQVAFTEFTRNYAYQGPAIFTDDIRNVINNTVFLKNKQEVPIAEFKNENYNLTLQLLDGRYFFNAVYSWFPLDCLNITYWNGTVTTVSEPDTKGGAGINLTVEVYDSNNSLIKKEIRQTDKYGKLVYDYFDFDGGNYTFKIIHEEDDYYSEFSKTYQTTVADFAKLQTLLYLAKDSGIVNLTRNFTYSIGYDTLRELVVYSENLTIYGNGYTIDASNQPVSFSAHLKNITFLNCTFKNGMDFHIVVWENALFSDCNFENSGFFRCNNASSCQIINCNFDSIEEGSYFSACEFADNNITIIKNSNFTNNFINGADGAAIRLRNNNYELITGCNFINNTDATNYAGAIYGTDLKNFNLVNSSFINNTAGYDGGALVLIPIADAIINIDGCIFINNTAKESAGAIKVYGDSVIRNSVFLNNKAASGTVEMNVVDLDTISISFEGQNDYINAIVAYGSQTFDNVTYWDGTVTNTNEKSPVKATSGQNITIKAFDKNDNLIFQTVEKTDENGQLIYAIYNLPYETKYVVCYHEDDAYYAKSANVTRNVTRMADFDRLQLLINDAGENGVVNLTRNYTYAEGFETSEYLYLNYNNITINGNGYSLNFNETGFIYINEANGIKLNNISFTGGERQSALIYVGGDCEINDCNFTNSSLGSDNVIHLYKINTNLAVKNTNFINITATAIRLDDFTSASIYNSHFINNTQAISAGGNTFNGYVKSLLISESSFTNNSDINNSAALNLKADIIKIENSNFTNNKGTDGGAIYARANEISVSGCDFFNNSANNNGGAVYIADPNKSLNVDNSTFRFNSADIGPAIYCADGNCTLNNVTVLDNRAQSVSLLEVETTGNNDVVMKFEGKNNYINGIYSNSIGFHNVVYWNGEIVNSDDVYPVENQYSGQKINIEVYDSNDNLVENVTLVTDGQNKVYYKLINGENGNYSFKAYHLSDNYYSYIGGCNGTFESIRPGSSVNINIVNGTEFTYSDCNISFDIINKTVTRVVITNIGGSQVYINQTTDDDYIIVDLDPSEDYYNITVYNEYAVDYVGSHDSRLFKILKIKPSIIIDPIPDIVYNNEFAITFDGENFENVNLTVFDVYGNVVFSKVSSNKYVTIPVLPVGTYNVTITSEEDKYHSNVSNSSKFNIIKAYANVTVSVDNVTYGDESMIVVTTDVGGVYTVDVNGTVRNVTVDGNVGKVTLSLGAGKYYANVTSFDNGNYSINSTNAIFEVYKAINNVRVITANVTYGSKSVIYVNADVDGVYTVDVNGTVRNVTVEGNVGKVALLLGAGKYYANVTYPDKGNYSTIISNAVFEVYKAANNVQVSVDSIVYGEKAVIYVVADVDGEYTVDVNGTITEVTVVNKRGNFSLSLDAGKYYANVTSFDDGNYSIISNNEIFEVYKAINNIKVIASSVTYGNESVIYVVADVDGNYTLDLNGNVSTIEVVDGQYSRSMRLDAGKYYANVTFDNDNYDNIISNAAFEVYKAVNNVYITVSRSMSSDEVILQVVADVDGNYTLDFTGEVSTIEVIDGNYSVSLILAPGKYYANVTFDNDNYLNKISNIEFEIGDTVNNVYVIANSVTYGEESVIYVIADVDGVYTIDVNGTIGTVNVVGNLGNFTLSLGAGSYYANVTFDNKDYDNVISNAVFEVYKAVNNVYVIANSVTYGEKTVIFVAADVDGVYTVDVNGTITEVNVVDKVGNFTLSLDVGRYYANVTYENANYSNVISNDEFRVHPAVNNVKVTAKNVVYGNDVIIEVIADADGVYTLDVNGTVSTINVVNGTGSKSVRLGAGKYYANVTFDNGNYSNIITNAVFEVYKAVNNVKVNVANVVYGEKSVIVVSADLDGVYTVDVNGTITEVNVVGNVGNFTLSLGVGKYYAKAYSFESDDYVFNITNASFEVYKAVNNVRVIVNNVIYGEESVVVVSADVDGVYVLDLNGNVSEINVVDGKYSVSVLLPVGKYYANVTFDNGNYSSVINNAVFEVYKAVNNVKVFANSVSYGNDVVLVVVADVDGGYKLDVNGNISKIKVVNGNYST
uniref:hypothetical protein n=1 Tax=Methanobrevibacter sp. TaxID=66852 RepID=UPI00388FE090